MRRVLFSATGFRTMSQQPQATDTRSCAGSRSGVRPTPPAGGTLPTTQSEAPGCVFSLVLRGPKAMRAAGAPQTWRRARPLCVLRRHGHRSHRSHRILSGGLRTGERGTMLREARSPCPPLLLAWLRLLPGQPEPRFPSRPLVPPPFPLLKDFGSCPGSQPTRLSVCDCFSDPPNPQKMLSM